jgi:hypothetical protein
MKKYFFILVVSFIGLNSCDKIDDPYEGIEKPIIAIDTTTFCGFAEYDSELNDTTYNDTTSNIRKVLLEEYTGHLCGFCPPESKRLVAKTENELKGKAIVMSIHAANFAALVNSKGYTTDFTTPEGDQLHERYKGGNSAPSLMMNRSNTPASASQWDGKLDSLDKSGYYTDQVVKFKIRNIYNESIKTGRIDLDIEFLKDFTGTNFVVGVYITEDHILDKQKYYGENPEDVDNYDHRHVIRTAATPTFGARFVSGDVTTNQKESPSFCYELQDEWNSDNCSVIIFLGNADNNQIFQAEEVHVKSE